MQKQSSQIENEMAMMQAMQESLETEPITTDHRSRIEEVPVGLKNVGNTCYFNSFMQAFFFLPNIQEKFTHAVLKSLS